jgi:2-polyprenyl-6-methoxyphenol hydroxylase-like FAD-dependent oxidoreductase
MASGKAKDARIIVVGAGPTGMVIALGLARTGAQITVLEADQRVTDAPRAAVYLPSTIAGFAEIGVLESIEAVAAKGNSVKLFYPSLGLTASLTMDVLEGLTPYLYSLHLGQNIVAEIILSHLQRLPNARALFGRRVHTVTQNGAVVRVTASTSSGEETYEADWVVGADGARSGVRRALGLDFVGHTWPDRYVATNVRYDFTKHGYAPANQISDGKNWAIIAVISKDGLWRVTYGEDPDLPEEEAIRRIPEHYVRWMDLSEPYKIVAAQPYRVHERAAERFRVGRVLLAGDAAHVTQPIGGLGLTTGMHDARALINALSAVIKGEADEDVLDTYAEERRRIFFELVTPSSTEHKRRIQETDPERHRRDAEETLKAAQNSDIVRQFMMFQFSLASKPVVRRRA